MRKILLFFTLLFVAVFGATVEGKGHDPTFKQLAFTPAGQDQMVGLTQESAISASQPIELMAEVVTPRCRDVQFSYSSQFFGTSLTHAVFAEFSEAIMNLTQESAGTAELRAEVVIPRCRTVLLTNFFQNDLTRNFDVKTQAVSPNCRDVKFALNTVNPTTLLISLA